MKKLLIYFLSFFFFCLFLSIFFLNIFLLKKEYIKVPYLEGKNLIEALPLLKETTFKITEFEEDYTKPHLLILGQSPSPLIYTYKGATLQLKVNNLKNSLDKSLLNLTEQEAEDLLNNKGILIKKYYIYGEQLDNSVIAYAYNEYKKECVLYINRKKNKQYIVSDLSEFNCQYIKEQAYLHNIKVKCFSLADGKELVETHHHLPIKDFSPGKNSLITKNTSIVIFH